jgi:hypothetical protein
LSPAGTYCLSFLLAAGLPAPREGATPGAAAAEVVQRLPLAFAENVGQWKVPSRFVARRGSLRAHLAAGSFTLQLLGEREEGFLVQNVRFVFEGAAEGVVSRGEGELPGRSHYFLGSDPAEWRTEARSFSRVVEEGLYVGVDLVWREEEGRLEYDLILAPGADLGSVVVRVEGGAIRVDGDGSLVIATEAGEIRQAPPRTWEEGDGERRPLVARYRPIEGNRFGIVVPDRDPDRTLVVDPGFTYSTYLGGSGDDTPWGIAVDPTGVAVIVGRTYSVDFPTTPGVLGPSFFSTFSINSDAFVSRVSASGAALLSSTYLGGANGDAAESVVLDATGAAWIAGRTRSTDFPATPGALDTTYNGGIVDGFVAQIPPAGNAILYSTYLGGSDTDQASSIVLDPTGAVILAGNTSSDDFPVTPAAVDPDHNGGSDLFVARFYPATGALSFSTFLGGSLDDANSTLLHGPSVAIHPASGIFVAGPTSSPNFPTTSGAYDTTLGGGRDGFLVRLPFGGSPLLASTYLGGSGWEEVFGLGLLPTGAATLAGSTDSPNFPSTPGAFDQTYNGGNGASVGDAFVARLNASLSNLGFATFLGGALDDRIVALELDPTGAATVGGRTDSADFPVTVGAYDGLFAGPTDAFLSRLGPAGDVLRYSTFIGSAPGNEAWALVLDSASEAVAAGWTVSPSFPTSPSAYDPTYNGVFDVWVAKFDLLPEGVERYGNATTACGGPLVIGVNSMPEVGNDFFSVTCGNATPFTAGIFLLGGAPLAAPFPVASANIWVSPAGPFLFLLTATANEIGAAERFLPIPHDSGLEGGQVYAQFLWIDLCNPGALASSPGLSITIQP